MNEFLGSNTQRHPLISGNGEDLTISPKLNIAHFNQPRTGSVEAKLKRLGSEIKRKAKAQGLWDEGSQNHRRQNPQAYGTSD